VAAGIRARDSFPEFPPPMHDVHAGSDEPLRRPEFADEAAVHEVAKLCVLASKLAYDEQGPATEAVVNDQWNVRNNNAIAFAMLHRKSIHPQSRSLETRLLIESPLFCADEVHPILRLLERYRTYLCIPSTLLLFTVGISVRLFLIWPIVW
jgi:hypothetical protein